MIKELKSRIAVSSLYPKAAREYIFLMGTIRYVKRKIIRPNEWLRILSKPPRAIGLNVTDICNANCCYCAYRFHKPEGVMDMQVYEKTVREFSELGGGAVGLSPVTGEPLLDPYLVQRIEFARQFHNVQKITFSTNGILFQQEEIVENLIRLSSKIKIQISTSLPGFEKKMFERVYGVGNYDRILTGIHNLLKTNRDKNSPLDIYLKLQPDRGGVLQHVDFKKMIRPYIDNENIMVSPRVEDNWCGQIKQEHLTGDMIFLRPLKFRSVPCQLLLVGTIDVLVNGDVRMCGCVYGSEGKHDSLVIGNIKERSLSEIWFGNGPKKICEQFLKSELPDPCQKCLLYEPY